MDETSTIIFLLKLRINFRTPLYASTSNKKSKWIYFYLYTLEKLQYLTLMHIMYADISNINTSFYTHVSPYVE